VSFEADISKWATGAKASVERTRRAVVLTLFGSVIKDTPVLTGRLRGNWQTSVESPLTGQIPERGGRRPRIVPPELHAEIMKACADAKGKDVPIYMRNNLPYAHRIEYDGWSKKKSPEGMVRRNIARIRRNVAEAVREGKL
jgi:hypothetical protein